MSGFVLGLRTVGRWKVSNGDGDDGGKCEMNQIEKRLPSSFLVIHVSVSSNSNLSTKDSFTGRFVRLEWLETFSTTTLEESRESSSEEKGMKGSKPIMTSLVT